MDKLTLECRAKINLALDVVGERPDGYHLVEMILQEIPLADRLTLRVKKEKGITVHGEMPGLPLNEENLAYRAATAFFERLGREEGLDIYLEKRIPMGAGLGGGSADAAGVLKGLNAIFGQPFEKEKLMEIGGSLGADIPFCIMGGCALARGVGEVLTPLPMPPALKCVLAKPEPQVSTRWVYQHLDYTKKPKNLNVEGVAAAIRNGDLAELCAGAGNILETVTIPAYPVVGWMKQALSEAGAVLTLMSGSGSAVFGLFRNGQEAECGAEQARRYTQEVFVL